MLAATAQHRALYATSDMKLDESHEAREPVSEAEIVVYEPAKGVGEESGGPHRDEHAEGGEIAEAGWASWRVHRGIVLRAGP